MREKMKNVILVMSWGRDSALAFCSETHDG
jgi:hypothetical protein